MSNKSLPPRQDMCLAPSLIHWGKLEWTLHSHTTESSCMLIKFMWKDSKSTIGSLSPCLTLDTIIITCLGLISHRCTLTLSNTLTHTSQAIPTFTTTRTHCAVYRFMAIILWTSCRQVEMLLACTIVVANRVLIYKIKSTLSVPDLDMNWYYLYFNC